jgi:hypothetical protein
VFIEGARGSRDAGESFGKQDLFFLEFANAVFVRRNYGLHVSIRNPVEELFDLSFDFGQLDSQLTSARIPGIDPPVPEVLKHSARDVYEALRGLQLPEEVPELALDNIAPD